MAYVGRPPSNATLSSGDIADGIIVAADLAPDSVGASELADDAVDTAAIADSVTLVTPNLGIPSAVTLTNATFPSGHVTNVFPFKVTSGGTAEVADAKEVAFDAVSWSAISGRKYYIHSCVHVFASKNENNASGIIMTAFGYYGTTNRSQGDTTYDTELGRAYHGRNLMAATTTSGGTFSAQHIVLGNFTAGSTATHYFYLALFSGSAVTGQMEVSSSFPWETIIYEVMP